jgi:tight adherence protein B
VTALALAALAGVGTYLLVTADRRRSAPSPTLPTRAMRLARLRLDQAGLDDIGPGQFVGASAAVGLVAAVPAMAIFGIGLPATIVALAATATPTVLWRRERSRRRRAARAAWPRLIEELRVLTGSVGRSIPQALLEVGLRGPVELQPAFRAAQREWSLTTDLERMLRVLKEQLDDPTADAACETLLVAAQVGGEIDERLAALAEDRRQDLAGRRDAEAKQSGARFARSFVILVPAGMALAGLSVGDGRAAYQTPQGQLLVAIGLLLIGGCWWWAGRVMRLPEAERVFDR